MSGTAVLVGRYDVPTDKPKNSRKSSDGDKTPRASERRAANVRVSKDITAMVRKTAPMLGKSVEDFVTPLLVECRKLIDDEIKAKGIEAVTARSNALEPLSKVESLGPLNVDAETATPLVRLAGFCQTSIAKLIDPHLRKLVQKEYQAALRAESKAAGILQIRHASVTLPVLGKVPAGRPRECYPDADEFDFAAHFGGDDDLFMLKVSGTSMIDDHIAPGDLVVIRYQPEAEPGSRVVALVDGKPTLKKLKQERDRKTGERTLWLYPCNGDMEKIPYNPDDGDTIVGVLVGVVRCAA